MAECVHCGHPNPVEAKFCGGCGARTVATGFGIGATVAGGRYRIESLLGEGGMGTVWRAVDTALDRTVALKCLNADLTAHPTARRRMEQEARILARVEHPNIVQVRNVFEEAGVLVMELEYVAGGDLESRVKPGGLADGEVLRLIMKVLEGLEAIHNASLIHRDVKPANVLLDAAGEPKITDLGVAHDPTARAKTKHGATLGTPAYMSPEQVKGLAPDVRSDLYAVGVMCYQLLSGQLPFGGDSEFDVAAAHIHQAPDLALLARRARPEAVAWVARALAKDPASRWQSAKEMRAAAAEIVTGQRSAAPPSAEHKQVPPPPPAAPKVAPQQPPSSPPAVPRPPQPVQRDKRDVPQPRSSASSNLIIGAILGALIVGLAVVLIVWEIVQRQAAEEESTTTSGASSSTQGSSSPTARAPDAPAFPTFRVGDRWRFRQQRLPRNTSDVWRTYDHFVDRTVTSVEPLSNGIAVAIDEIGGPQDDEVRRFVEVYTTEGVGKRSGGNVEVLARWEPSQQDQGDITVGLPAGPVRKIGNEPTEFWVHPTLGKVAEVQGDVRKGDTHRLTLVGYDVAGAKGGNIDDAPLKCVWSNRTKWLEPGTVGNLPLAGRGHQYALAEASRGILMSGSLQLSGANVESHRLADQGELLIAKTWITPTDGEWVAALWWNLAGTTVTFTHLRGASAKSFTMSVSSVVSERGRAVKDHSLLLLQRGNQCVVGIKAVNGGTRGTAMILVPDDSGGETKPRMIGGDWR